MQISIDTARDSKEDIVKAIHLLQSIIGETHISSVNSVKDIFNGSSPDISQNSQSQQPQQQSQGSVFGSFFDNVNNASKPVEKKVCSRVELY